MASLSISLGFGIGHGGSSLAGYYILIAGANSAGNFNVGETTSLATATTNITGTITWSIVSGSDARISINSSSGAVSTSSAILSGDSAAFTVRATNGTTAVEFPFTAVGTVAGSRLILEGGSYVLLETGDKILLEA